MTVLGYFNSLRELGGARRVVEDEVGSRVAGYGSRNRVGETEGLFENRKIAYEPIELNWAALGMAISAWGTSSLE